MEAHVRMGVLGGDVPSTRRTSWMDEREYVCVSGGDRKIDLIYFIINTTTRRRRRRQRKTYVKERVREGQESETLPQPAPVPALSRSCNQPIDQSMNQSTMNDDRDQPRSRPARTTMRTSAHHLTTLPGVPGMVGRCRPPVVRAHELRSGEGGEGDGSGKFCYLAGFTYE